MHLTPLRSVAAALTTRGLTSRPAGLWRNPAKDGVSPTCGRRIGSARSSSFCRVTGRGVKCIAPCLEMSCFQAVWGGSGAGAGGRPGAASVGGAVAGEVARAGGGGGAGRCAGAGGGAACADRGALGGGGAGAGAARR